MPNIEQEFFPQKTQELTLTWKDLEGVIHTQGTVLDASLDKLALRRKVETLMLVLFPLDQPQDGQSE